MALSTTTTLRGDADDLFSRQLRPDHFAQRVIPAPRALRRSFLQQILGSLHAFLIVTSVVSCGATVLYAITGQPLGHMIGIVLLSLLALSMVGSVRIITAGSRRFRHQIIGREVDDRFRLSCHAEVLRQLEEEAEDVPVDSAFVQSAVEGIQRTLSQVGIPNVQVCILSPEGSGVYVSYYAGYDQSTIAQGAMISDFSIVGSRCVVCRLPCPLGLESNNELAIVATCTKLGDADKKFVQRAISLMGDLAVKSSSSGSSGISASN